MQSVSTGGQSDENSRRIQCVLTVIAEEQEFCRWFTFWVARRSNKAHHRLHPIGRFAHNRKDQPIAGNPNPLETRALYLNYGRQNEQNVFKYSESSGEFVDIEAFRKLEHKGDLLISDCTGMEYVDISCGHREGFSRTHDVNTSSLHGISDNEHSILGNLL
jgi:hypothetical protein